MAGDGGGSQLLTADFSVAVMLMAAVTYLMTTFCLVNHSDDDIRKAAWSVMSTTISIFSAVLLFQGINEVVAFYFLDGARPELKLMVNMAHAAIWYLILQGALAFISGAVTMQELCVGSSGVEDPESSDEEELDMSGLHVSELNTSDPESTRKGEDKEEAPKPQLSPEEEAQLTKSKLNMKCWAVLLGHITGFACINAFGTLQIYVVAAGRENPEPTRLNLWLAVAAGPIAAWIVLEILYFLMDLARRYIAMGDDGEVDEFEELWDEETEETEDDVLGLTMSFTMVQVLRFALTGVLPNEEGEVEGAAAEHLQYHLWQCGALVGLGLLWFGVHIFFATCCHGVFSERKMEQFKVVAGMIFSWCFFFGAQWFVHMTVLSWGLSDEGFETINSVVLAVVLNVVCYMKIFILDKIADAEWSGEEMDDSIRQLIGAVGILIGFAWEKSFDAAVVTTASRITALPSCVTKLILSVIICGTVIPAWRWYILPILDRLGLFDEEEDEEDSDDEGKSSGSGESDVENREEKKNENRDLPVPAIRGMEKAEAKASPARGKAGKSGLAEPLLTKAEQETQQVRAEIEQTRLEKLARTNRLRALKARTDARLQAAKGLRSCVEAAQDELARYRDGLTAQSPR